MSTTAIADPVLLPEYVKRARKLFGERYASRLPDEWTAAKKLSNFIKSIDRLFAAISDASPKGNLVIEDVIIKGHEIVVKYNSPVSTEKGITGALSGCQAVTINSLNILRLSNGRVMEYLETVYQVKGIIDSP